MGTVFSSVTVSVDGFLAGEGQSLETPMGHIPPPVLHRWQFERREENREEAERVVRAGAFIMGRNMFTPDRGDWDLDWTGWWGDDPPYHGPVFVLTNHPREPLVLEGNNSFSFVTDGIQSALEQAKAAAGNADISIAGGADTVNQFMRAGLLEELTVHISPVVIGRGARLFEGVENVTLTQTASVGREFVTHITYALSY